MSKKQEYQIKKWQSIIKECQASGMKIREWCAAHDVSKSAYYYWLSKLRTEHYEVAVRQLQTDESIINTPITSPVHASSFVEIESEIVNGIHNHADLSMSMAVVQKGVLRVEIMQNATASFMRQLLEAVQYA